MADGSRLTVMNPRIAPDEVWARVREDYRSGMTAAEACRRHGVGITAMRSRAAREGWRRSDEAWTPPADLDPEDEGLILEKTVDGDLDRVELSELAWVASRRMMRAVMRGQAAEALRWRRVRMALDAEDAELERFMAREEVLRRELFGDGPAVPADRTASTASTDRAHPAAPVFPDPA